MSRPRCDACGQFNSDRHACAGQPSKVCMVDGCTDDAKCRGWCGKHYNRWYHHGDPTRLLDPTEHAPRSDAAKHGSHAKYTGGCRCFTCRVAWARYQADYKAGRVPPRPTVATVAGQLRDLIDAGWTREDLCAETGMSTSGFYRYMRGDGTYVARRIADPIKRLHEAIQEPAGRLPALPLTQSIRRYCEPRGGLAVVLNTRQRKALYRAERAGSFTHAEADRMAVEVLGLPLMLIYGQEAA